MALVIVAILSLWRPKFRPSQIILDLLWSKWHWNRFFFGHLSFRLLISLRHCFIPTFHTSIMDTI